MELTRISISVPPPSVGPRDTISPGHGGAVLLRARARGVPLPVTVGQADLGGGGTHQVQIHAASNYTGALAMLRLIPAVFVAAILAACSESSTSPDATTTPEQRPSFSVTVPGTNVAVNSFSCSLVSSTKGDVLCSYNVSNPDGLTMEITPQARVDIAYQCLNSNTGKVMSTGSQMRFVYNKHVGITATTYSATDEALPTASLYIVTNHPYTKYNPCKSNQTTVVTGYSLVYWVLNLSVSLGSSSLGGICVASNNSLGCKTL